MSFKVFGSLSRADFYCGSKLVIKFFYKKGHDNAWRAWRASPYIKNLQYFNYELGEDGLGIIEYKIL